MSDHDLVRLTGLRRASAQVRWLSERGWAFALRADGSPVVAVAELEAQMCTGRTVRRKVVGPNLAALDRLG